MTSDTTSSSGTSSSTATTGSGVTESTTGSGATESTTGGGTTGSGATESTTGGGTTGSGGASEPADPQGSLPPPNAGWLERLNFYRQAAGLTPLIEDPASSKKCLQHAKYIVATGTLNHAEDTTKPGFTPEGNYAGMHSILAGDHRITSDRGAIEFHWMQAPIHWLGAMNPALTTVGYGTFTNPESTSGLTWGAALDVRTGLSEQKVGAVFPSPVLFPGNGATLPIAHHWGELPEVAKGCGYALPTGLPIVAQFGTWLSTNVTDHALSTEGAQVEHCVLHEVNFNTGDAAYDALAKQTLNSQGAVLVVPKSPLAPGQRYDVSVTSNGVKAAWSFRTSVSAQ